MGGRCDGSATAVSFEAALGGRGVSSETRRTAYLPRYPPYRDLPFSPDGGGNKPAAGTLYVGSPLNPPPLHGSQQEFAMAPQKPALLSALSLVVGLSLFATAASAAELRLRCEQRFAPTRSKISVDGKNLFPQNAMYSARVISGSNQSTHVPLTAVGDEVEFDFDSDPGDIAAGAQAIPGTFITGGSVQAAIFDANGQMVVGPVTAACRMRVPVQVRSPSQRQTTAPAAPSGRSIGEDRSERTRR
jgi:hypothetical protein